MRLLMSNMRLPEERLGDLNASLGACRVAEERIGRLVAKYGRDTVLGCIGMNLDRSERRLRNRIRNLPDGEFVYEDYLEFYDAGRLDPVLMRLKLTVDGDHVVADFDGSNPQVSGVVNSSLAVAGAGVFVALKSTLDPHGPVNSGAFRAFTLRAPEASIVDVRPEAPGRGARRGEKAGGVGDARGTRADHPRTRLGRSLRHVVSKLDRRLLRNARPPVRLRRSAGRRQRWVRRARRVERVRERGLRGHPLDPQRGVSRERDADLHRTLRVARRLRRRGPVPRGSRHAPRVAAGGGEAVYSVLGDRAFVPPFGVDGAGPAGPVRVAKVHDGRTVEFDTPGKVTGHPITAGDCVLMESAGGGGYGDPLRRDPHAAPCEPMSSPAT